MKEKYIDKPIGSTKLDWILAAIVAFGSTFTIFVMGYKWFYDEDLWKVAVVSIFLGIVIIGGAEVWIIKAEKRYEELLDRYETLSIINKVLTKENKEKSKRIAQLIEEKKAAADNRPESWEQ
jgi:hypothetical protein